jgi:hypothetical protein
MKFQNKMSTDHMQRDTYIGTVHTPRSVMAAINRELTMAVVNREPTMAAINTGLQGDIPQTQKR